MPNETNISRRGIFMKLGILFNGFVAAALAVPIGRYLLSSLTRGRGDGYRAWVSSRKCERLSGGRDPPGYLPESLRDADRWQDC